MMNTLARCVPLSLALPLCCATLSAQTDDPPIPADTEIQTTDSGLKYSVLEAGPATGDSPVMGDQVEVHYTGWLTDGKVFDSSRKRNATAKFVLGQVIPGWNEGLQLMRAGARYKFTIPFDLAYGEAGSPPSIPPKSTLIFDVELVSFVAGPRFRAPNPEKQEATDVGLKYEILETGDGDPPSKDTTITMNYTLWNTEGKLLMTSVFQSPTPKGTPGQYTIGVLQKGPMLMKPGASYLFEVPADLGFGQKDQGPDLPPGSTTIWKLDLVDVQRPKPVPAFEMPPGDKLIETQSGLKYQVIDEGSGKSPRMGQMVEVHYAGWLTDGALFDASYSRGEPAEFRLGAVIQGWNEGLQLMKPGAKYKFVIPANLGYGERGSPPKIPGGSTLVFLVELIGVR